MIRRVLVDNRHFRKASFGGGGKRDSRCNLRIRVADIDAALVENTEASTENERHRQSGKQSTLHAFSPYGHKQLETPNMGDSSVAQSTAGQYLFACPPCQAPPFPAPLPISVPASAPRALVKLSCWRPLGAAATDEALAADTQGGSTPHCDRQGSASKFCSHSRDLQALLGAGRRCQGNFFEKPCCQKMY